MYGDRIENIKNRNSDITNDLETSANDILFSRYTFDVTHQLEEYIQQFGEDENCLVTIIDLLRRYIEDHENERKSLLFPETTIPEKLIENNSFARKVLSRKLKEFRNSELPLSMGSILEFMIANHEWIKWSLNQWFLVNSSTMAEIVVVDESIEAETLCWYREEFGVEIGQSITHPHLISTNGKKRLSEEGFPDVEQHLSEESYAEMMRYCYMLSIATPGSKGFFARGWIYNPEVNTIQKDDKPFVAFNFLRNDHITGIRKLVSTASPFGPFSDQYGFITRNERRKALIESGEFVPNVFAVFYPNNLLGTNIALGLLDPKYES